MNKETGLIILGFSVIGWTAIKKFKRDASKKVQIVIENEVPLKLEFLNDDISHMKKDLQKEGIRKTLKYKYDECKSLVLEICCYFKIDFQTYLKTFKIWKSDIPKRDILIRFDWNKRFRVNEYRDFLVKYLEILNDFDSSKNYEEFLLSENILYNQMSQKFDLDESSLKGAHLRFHYNPKVLVLLNSIQKKKKTLDLNIDYLGEFN